MLRLKMKVNIAAFAVTSMLGTIPTVGYNLANMNNAPLEATKVVFEPIEEPVDNHGYTQEQALFERTKEVSDTVLEDKTYSGMNLSHEYEDTIRVLCDDYASNYELDNEKLFQAVLTIGDQESDGNWNNNGIISPTYDYGEFQINIANHKKIKKELGYTSNDLLYDSYKNADAAVWIVSNIMINEHCQTTEDIYGMYNGWINWEKKAESVEYVEGCVERASTYFGSNIRYYVKK